MKKLLFIALTAACLIGCEKYDPIINGNTNTNTNTNTKKIKIVNKSTLYSYTYSVDYHDNFVLDPGEFCDMYVNSNINIIAYQNDGFPTTGKYKDKIATYNNDFTLTESYTEISIPSFATLRLENKDSSHRYKITINHATHIKQFILEKNSYVDLDLDMAYYNVKAEQLDWILWPTDYNDDIYLNKNTKLTYQ